MMKITRAIAPHGLIIRRARSFSSESRPSLQQVDAERVYSFLFTPLSTARGQRKYDFRLPMEG
jgi:hypothetical protein